MAEVWIASLTLFIITLGFAGILGDLIFRLRQNLSIPLAFLSLLITSLVLFPPLSLPGILPWTLWGASMSIAVIFAVRPSRMPSFLLSRRFILQYACLAMLLSAMWYLTAGQSLMMSSLAVSALLAALLSWRESLDW